MQAVIRANRGARGGILTFGLNSCANSRSRRLLTAFSVANRYRSPLRPCSAAAIMPAATFIAGGYTIFAANLDSVHFCRGKILTNLSGLHKIGVIPGTTGVDAEWNSNCASVTFNVVGSQIAWEGMNEAGLVISNEGVPGNTGGGLLRWSEVQRVSEVL